MDIQAYLDTMTDDELLARADESYGDLLQVATESPGSDWHDACFAGLYIFATEMNNRGLKKYEAT